MTTVTVTGETIVVTVAEQGPPGVDSDHGGLTGLADDDHTQYHTDARGDARYAVIAHAHTGIYEPAGTAASAISSHEGAADPHTGYALESSLGGAALLSVGTTAGTVAAGDDARFSTGTTGDAFASSHPGGNQHIDWTADQGATNLHAGNIPDLSGTYATAAQGGLAATALQPGDVDDMPVNGVTTAPVSSNWAYDHAALTTAHGISTFGASLVDDADAGTARTTLGLGTAATTAATDYATASHAHAGTYLPVGVDAADLTSGAATDNYVLTADGAGGAAWEAAAVTYAGVASETHAATEKTTPVDADEVPLVDSAASFGLKRLTWANIKTTLSGVFALLAGKAGGQTLIGGTAVGDALSLQGTSGNGTVTGTALAVKVGNNGALTALTVANNGQLTIQGDATTDLPVYSAELLTSAGWTVNTGWTESPDDTFAHTSGTDTLTHSATITASNRYRLEWTITGRTSGTLTFLLGSLSSPTNITASGSYYFFTLSTASFSIIPSTDFNGVLSLLSLKKIETGSVSGFSLKNSSGTTQFEIRSGNSSTNQFVGYRAGESCIVGTYNLALGSEAQKNNMGGNYNIAIGSQSQYSLSSGLYNTAIGSQSQYSLITGVYNTAIGFQAQRDLKYAGYNTAVGYAAQQVLTSGELNVVVGAEAQLSLTTGNANNGIGFRSQFSLTSGSGNVSVGMNASYSLTTGTNNVFIGRDSGGFHADGTTLLTDPESSIYIGHQARGKDNSDSNSVVIGGSTPIGLGANTTVIGTSATTLTRLYGNVATGVDAPSAAFHAIKTTEQLRLGYDASNYASFTVDSAGNLSLANTGTTPSVYIATLRSGCKVTAVTTTASPAATDAGTVYTNEGDADGATITLPTAAAGLNLIAYVQTAQTLTITASSGDTIRIASSVTAAAGSITSNVVGSSVTLVAINATEWVATSSIGSWSF
jgi:hypothetical protein